MRPPGGTRSDLGGPRKPLERFGSPKEAPGVVWEAAGGPRSGLGGTRNGLGGPRRFPERFGMPPETAGAFREGPVRSRSGL